MESHSNDKLRVLDLFAGIGGFTLGLEKTGLYETVAFCEWDKACQKVLHTHWPNVQIFEDISDLEGQNGCVKYCYEKSSARGGLYDLYIFRNVDVITGGFPCQDISNSGGKLGINGPRSGYWNEFSRLIKQIKPKGVIIENVSALRSRGLGKVLSDLNKIGYDAEWHCIPASHLGAIHKRDRIWIIAYPTRFGQQKPWRPLESLSEEETRNREANIIKHALQREPLPYVCRDHNGFSRNLDRVKQLGNSVYWPIVEKLGYHLHRNIT